MAPYWHLLQLIAVAIVMIAAGWLPSRAEAHAGHQRGVAAGTQAAQIQVAVAVVPAARRAVARPAGLMFDHAAHGDGLVSAVSSGSAPLACGPCDGMCCGTGLACCAPATIPDTSDLQPPSGRAGAIVWPERAAHLGADPEALPKPPRSFV